MRAELCWLYTTVLIVLWQTAVDCCRSSSAILTATADAQGIVFPDMAITNSEIQWCSWIISAPHVHDVISFQITDWFGPASRGCGNDYLVIKDGASAGSPNLRSVCGETFFRGVISSTSGAIYVQFHVDDDDGQRGFALEYWSEHKSPMTSQSPMYGPANYVLMCVTASVTVLFIGGLLYLVYREKYKQRQVKEVHMKQMLKRRRKGISGMSGGEDSCYSETSRTDVTSFQEDPSPVSGNWRV